LPAEKKNRSRVRWISAALIFFGLGATSGMADPLANFLDKLPARIGPWSKAEQPERYGPENLYTYIDGGAELYLSYNFQGLLAMKYVNENGDEITVDICDMGDSANAFGVFSHSRETTDMRVGQGCEYSSGLLTFWKDRYYVSLLSYPETAEKKETIFALAAAIVAGIPQEGQLPPVIARLPAVDLVPESVRFFHHYIWLNSFYFVSHQNLLLIDERTAVALGKYRHPAGAFLLLVVEYPDELLAKSAQESFQKEYLGNPPDAISQRPDGRWAGCARQENVLAVVLNAPEAATVSAYLKKDYLGRNHDEKKND